MDCNCEKAPEFPTKAFIPSPIEIPINFRAVTIPADQGDDVAKPPLNGAYRNVVLKYAANGHTYIYSSDGVPVMLVGSITFDSLPDRPQYDGQPMNSHTNIPNVTGDIEDIEDDIDEINDKIAALATDFSYKGSVADYAHLPSDAAVGDVYTTADTGVIYVWDGSAWVALNDNKGTLLFYANNSETGTTRHIYKNADMTGEASAQDILNANDKGQVVLRMSTSVDPTSYNDAYLQNAYVSTSPYDCQLLFLDNRYYYEYDASSSSTTAFDYSRTELQFKITPVQTIGTSTTDLMSQNAVTKMVYANPATATSNSGIQITTNTSHTMGADSIILAQGPNAEAAYGAIAIGLDARATKNSNIAIGNNVGAFGTTNRGEIAIGNRAHAHSNNATTPNIAIGSYASSEGNGNIALGYGAKTEYAIGSDGILCLEKAAAYNTTGHNSSQYMLIRGVYDGQNAHDAATKGQLDAVILQNAGAPTTATVGTVGQLLEDTTNGKLYQCTAVTGDGGDPEVFTYTWTEIASGGSVPTVYDSTISITNNSSALDSFTVNASSNKTIALDYPVITMTSTDPGEGGALAANNFIAVYNAS